MIEAILLRKQKEIQAYQKSQSSDYTSQTYQIGTPEADLMLASLGKLTIVKELKC